MENNIFSQGLDKVFGAVSNGVSTVANGIGNAFNNVMSSHMTYVAPPIPAQPTAQPQPTGTPTVDPTKMMAAIRYNETRGEKNPYAYYRSSGSKTQGNALGAYQVTQGELDTYAPKFLGKPVTQQQFLSNPQLQDQYMKAKIQHGLNDLKLTPQEILATHRGGYSNPQVAMVKYKSYVDSGMSQYNQGN